MSELEEQALDEAKHSHEDWLRGYDAARERLTRAIEAMPTADSEGRWGWAYPFKLAVLALLRGDAETGGSDE